MKSKHVKREHKANMNARYLVFLLGILGSAVLLIMGLYRLQIVNGEYYAERAGTRSNKTIVLKGTRGMITDAEGVILAKSEKIYNVTFQRDNSQSSTSQYKAFTDAIIETISILKKYNGDISVTFPIERCTLDGSMIAPIADQLLEGAAAVRRRVLPGRRQFRRRPRLPLRLEDRVVSEAVARDNGSSHQSTLARARK